MLLLQQMIVLFFMMLLGYYIRKKEFITDTTCKQLSWLVVNVANPAMIISGSVNSESVIRGNELLRTLALAVLLFLVMIVLSRSVLTLLILSFVFASIDSYNVFISLIYFYNVFGMKK